MSNDTMQARIPVTRALEKANSIVAIADVYGWPRPQGYDAARAMVKSVRSALNASPAFPPPPDKPKDVAQWIEDTADIRQREATRRQVADELLLLWERNTAHAGLSAIPDTTPRLVELFDELLAEFNVHAWAPRQLTGHETTQEIEAHTAALRVAGQLSNALTQRAFIADAAGEGEYIGGDPVWLVINPTGATTRDEINGAIEKFKHRMPQTVSEWDELQPLGLRLAQLGEVEARRQRHAEFVHKIAMSTADLGMKDHAYSEFDDPATGAPYGAAIQAESNRMFAEAPSMNI